MLAYITLMAADAAEAASHSEESAGGLPQMDFSTYPSQIFWLLITFGILYFFMSSSILPRLGGTIEDRRDRIADDLDQAAESRRQAEAAEEAYKQSLAEARARAQAIAAETREEIDAEIASMQAEAEERVAAKISAAEAKIDDMKVAAKANVKAAATDVAREIISTLIDENPTEEAVSSAVNQVIN
ncbi:MAG: hypothetical protein AAGH38_05240 [Pseudomonadota bacterium]